MALPSRWVGITGATLLALSMAASVSGPAAAAPRGPDHGTTMMRAQLPLLEVTDAITTALDARPAADRAGYAGLEISPETGTVTLSWKGAVPLAIQALADRQAAVRDVDLVVRAVLYSEQQLLAEAARLVASDGVYAVGVSHDSRGLVVTGRAGVAARRSAAAAERPVSSPMVVEYRTGRPVEGSASRRNDAVRWTGGARITGCSSGFGILVAGQPYMLTAAHCTTGSRKTIKDGNGDTMGKTASWNKSIDSVMIDVGNAQSRLSGRMYDGGYKSSTTEKVKGTSKPVNGTYVCASGSYTGTNCDIKVLNDRYLYYLREDPAKTTIRGVFARRQSAGKVAIGRGDSGGPVLTNTRVAREVKAAGIISAGSETVRCPKTVDPRTSECLNDLIYVPIQNLLRGGAIKTG